MDEQVSQLLSPEGWALLSSLPDYEESEAMRLADRLRREGHAADLVAAALTQSRLRARARAKFDGFADGMLFTPTGLEQATRFVVAVRHAQRFVAAGIDRVADLGCGIGADTMALAGLDRDVLGVERDEVTAAVATVNVRHWDGARIRNGDLREVDLGGFGGVWCDPARRSGGRRVIDPERAEPPLSEVVALAARVPALGMKTAPGIARDLVPVDAEAQWVSVDGDVVECALWFGAPAREGIRRSALVLTGGTAHEIDDRDLPVVPSGPVGAWLYEPDGAVIRSGLVGQVAAAVGGRLLDPTIAYVTADHLRPTPLATAYRVLEVMPFGLKRLRTHLRDAGVGRLTIKKRGTAVEPEQLRRQLRLDGDAEATIVLTRVAGEQSVLVVQPV